MTRILDLRGDWAARPTEAMRKAMAEAEVGDDNSHEDPTVIKLEERSAELMGKEAGLFVPSGTMGNLVSIMALAPHGTEIIAAPGLVALDQMIDRIPEDHENARKLAHGLADIPGFTVDLETVQSNLVFADISDGKTGPEIGAELEENGMRITIFGPQRIRFALHYEITSADVDHVINQIRQLI